MDLEELKFRKLLGARIQEIRKDKNLTQPELAALIGFKDYQTIGRIENGRVTPSVYTIHQIIKALEITSNELLNF
ncbi:helix-turn-helix domain-containing protein [Sphingobacterium bovistauri]|uniref:Helix-turn-helix transcriptional regulator n=1 Tax=Sphingobacterium bovistauri TaxID=2781959 RepID=A0ABS7Z6L0_9SPHI|nr:helix-turn-helix transcriptional regulator [Sphingobacterium bovistauri]MCA5005658.1 helix-turn-helix transcriptional regulator [Sphingobacterium bovistauri]